MRHVRSRAVVKTWLLAAVLILPLAIGSRVNAQTQLAPGIAPPGGYVRDRRHLEALLVVERLSKSGNASDFATAAQWILDQPRDSMTVSADGQAHSIRQTTEKLLSTTSKERLADYRRLIGPIASADLTKARSQESIDGLWEIVRRYFLTEAGGQAAIELMIRSLDNGAEEVAAALAARLIHEPAHRTLLTETVQRRIDLALQRTTQKEVPDKITAPIDSRDEPVSTTGQSSVTVKHRSAAVMSRPEWSLPLDFSHRYSLIDTRWKSWQAQQREGDQSTAIASKPLIVQGQVVFRDGDRVRAVDHRTGRMTWEQKTDLGFDALHARALSGPRDQETGAGQRVSLLANMLATHSAYFSLTTDGRRVYLVDGVRSALETLSSGAALRDLPIEMRREALKNDLIAINANPQFMGNDRRTWSLQDSVRDAESPLRDHTFLGPPLALPGYLLTITESDREICAVSVNPETGHVRWIQPIAEPDAAILDDQQRFFRSCTPFLSHGLVFCPTQLGSLVALDVTNGNFVWVHAHVDPRLPLPRNAAAFRQPPVLAQARNPAFNLRPWVIGDSVFYLAGQSESLYCLDVASGRVKWALSQPDGEYIGQVTEQAIIVFGRNAVRAYSTETSHELWSVRLPAVPSGFGAATMGVLLVPLSNGRLWRISQETGEILSDGAATERQPTGHLAVTRDGVVALGTDGVAAYRFAESVRHDLLQSQTAPHFTPQQKFQLAEVSLAEGELPVAAQQLEAVRKIGGAAWGERTDPLLRDAYFALLNTQPEKRKEWLGHLEPLCRDGEDRSRWLVALGDWQVSRADLSGLAVAMRDLSASPGKTLHDVQSDPTLSLSALGWMRRVLRRLPDTASRDFLANRFSAETQDSTDISRARSLETIFSRGPIGQKVRPRLAQAAMASGNYHAAEVWLLRNAESTDGSVAAVAVKQLAELYAGVNLPASAAEQWERLASEFAEMDCGDGVTGRKYVTRRSGAGEVAAAYRGRSPVAWSVRRAVVDSIRVAPASADANERGGNPLRDGSFQSSRFPRWVLHPRDEMGFEWRQRIDGAESVLMPWDRYAQQPRFEMRVPQGAMTPPVLNGRSIFENSLAVGLTAQMRMVSVLQSVTDGEAWTQTLSEWEGRSAMPIPGPATSRMQLFQIFSSRPTLVAVDPADGTILWRRNDLEPNSGLADRMLGIFADDDVIGILGEDRVSYRLLDAATGDVIRTGKLEADRTALRFAIGSRIIWVAEGTDGKRLRIWDAIEDRVIFEDSVRDRQFVSLTPDRELVWLTADDELCVLDVKRNQLLVRCPLDPSEAGRLSTLRVFRQAGRYFVNLARPQQVARTEHYYTPLSDHALPLMQIQDDLLAIDVGGTSVAWRQTVPKLGLMQWGRLPVPFLVGVSKVRDKADHNHEWMRVDLLDLHSGERLGVGDHLPKDRWVHADYDGSLGEIRIYGLQNTVRIRFGKGLQQIPESEDVL